jgi:hypothetical protein
MDARRLAAKWKAWLRQGMKSPIDGQSLPDCGGDAHEVWVSRSDVPRSSPARPLILTEPMNLVVVTNGQNVNMTAEMNRKCMLHLIEKYGEAAIDEWLAGLPMRNKKTVQGCLSEGYKKCETPKG